MDSLKNKQTSTNASSKEVSSNQPSYLIVHATGETPLSKRSPFLIQKLFESTIGHLKKIQKLRSGDLLVEAASPQQSEKLLKMKSLGDIRVTIAPQTSLNSSRGVISEIDLMSEYESDIQIGLSDQGVTAVRRISIHRDGKLIPTKHFIFTFGKPSLPFFVTAGYLRCSVRPYIPNPLRCFKCQRFGHTQTSCRGKSLCAQCGIEGHQSSECTSTPRCLNCNDAHFAYSRKCSAWQRERDSAGENCKQSILSRGSTHGQPKCFFKTEDFCSCFEVYKGFDLYCKDDDSHNRASGGVAIVVSNHIPSLPVQITTNLQAVAARICIGVTVTLPTPFLLLGDFNGHNPMRGSPDINRRGRAIERFTDWPAFSSLAEITEEMVNTADINDKVEVVTSSIIQAAEKTMGKTSTRYPKHPKPWWNQNCEAAFKAQKKAWGIFRRYPTASNFTAFKKTNARRVRRQSQRDSWRKYVSSITSSTSTKAVWGKIHKINGKLLLILCPC
ncbi:uncharacterized protein LOC111632122 [Centruroides sculpturatus]|uniref:uncharacterized protein LOC111632122 n=1 Tax=Centruroides sculpturatus TaxID=218467 RepID=UPI000C6E993C|nr:uncharacterized protein LOC111632122 [Centruroides sculpturatus]